MSRSETSRPRVSRPDRTQSEHLNQNCYCVGTDPEAVQTRLSALQTAHGLAAGTMPLFSALPVFVSPDEVKAMEAVVAAVDRTVHIPAWQSAVLAGPGAVEARSGSKPVLMGFDFHLSASGPRLIEINTNAGGALLGVEAARLETRAPGFDSGCLQPVIPPAIARTRILHAFTDQFLQRFGRPPARIAIVDDAPESQYLHAEFLLFVDLFREAGIEAVIADAADLRWSGNLLLAGGYPVDLIYNRVTDFDLSAPGHAALRAAAASDRILVTPDPAAHALLANKRNLAHLSDAGFLAGLGVAEDDRDTLLSGVPPTRVIDSADADYWWSVRDRYFFKPAAGFGSRGTYRGSKLTRRVFDSIIGADYVAQEYVPPAQRQSEPDPVDGGRPLKFDVRCYVFEGRIDFIAARLYEGQTTNFRTPGGGFAPVYLAPASLAPGDVSCSCPPAGD